MDGWRSDQFVGTWTRRSLIHQTEFMKGNTASSSAVRAKSPALLRATRPNYCSFNFGTLAVNCCSTASSSTVDLSVQCSCTQKFSPSPFRNPWFCFCLFLFNFKSNSTYSKMKSLEFGIYCLFFSLSILIKSIWIKFRVIIQCSENITVMTHSKLSAHILIKS